MFRFSLDDPPTPSDEPPPPPTDPDDDDDDAVVPAGQNTDVGSNHRASTLSAARSAETREQNDDENDGDLLNVSSQHAEQATGSRVRSETVWTRPGGTSEEKSISISGEVELEEQPCDDSPGRSGPCVIAFKSIDDATLNRLLHAARASTAVVAEFSVLREERVDTGPGVRVVHTRYVTVVIH